MTTTLRIDDNLKRDCEAVLGDLGLSMSGAVTLFLRQVVKQRAIPFAITCDRVPPPIPPSPSLAERGDTAIRYARKMREANAAALAAVDEIRAGRIERGEREWTMEEIDAEIAASRSERRRRTEPVAGASA